MSQSYVSGKPLSGRTVLFTTLAFFGVVIGVNVVMMKLAIDTLPGTEVDSAYSASLAYESEIKSADDQAQRAWRVNANIERSPDGEATIRVEARDRNGSPLTGLAFSGRLERPTDKRADRVLSLAEAGSGIYRGTAADVAPGQWDLVLESDNTTGQRVFLSINRVVLN